MDVHKLKSDLLDLKKTSHFLINKIKAIESQDKNEVKFKIEKLIIAQTQNQEEFAKILKQ